MLFLFNKKSYFVCSINMLSLFFITLGTLYYLHYVRVPFEWYNGQQ
jgi:hypothetical protein